MQLGTRWTAGGEPPASVPEALRRADRRGRSGPARRPAGTARAAVDADVARGPADRRARHRRDRAVDSDGEAVVRHDEDDEFA